MATTDGVRDEQIKAVQITLWLGADPKVEINLGTTSTKRLAGPDTINFHRSSTVSREKDLLLLVPEILRKLAAAFPKEKSITLTIDKYDEPVPSAASEKSLADDSIKSALANLRDLMEEYENIPELKQQLKQLLSDVRAVIKSAHELRKKMNAYTNIPELKRQLDQVLSVLPPPK